jgi:hypothetical protein
MGIASDGEASGRNDDCISIESESPTEGPGLGYHCYPGCPTPPNGWWSSGRLGPRPLAPG